MTIPLMRSATPTTATTTAGVRRRRLLVVGAVAGVIGVAGLLLVALVLRSGVLPVAALPEGVPYGAVLLCALLLGANEFLKGVRWGVYLRAGGLRITRWDAVSTHVASQVANVLPGNDWLAARFVAEHYSPRTGLRLKMRLAAPAVFARWAYDVIATTLIAAVGVTWFRGFSPALLLPVCAAFAVVLLLRAPAPARWIAHRLAGWERTRHLVRSEADFCRAARRVFRLRTAAAGVGLSLCTTAVSALALCVLVRGASGADGGGFGAAQALVTHAVAALATMVSCVPNGFGVADGGIAAGLHLFGVGAGPLVFATVSLRLVNIATRTLVGLGMVIARYRFLWAGGLRQFGRRLMLRDTAS